MSRAIRIGIIAVAALPAVALCGSAVFAMDRASNGGEVLGRVAVGGVELSGLSEAQARRTLQELEADMSSNPLTFDVQGTRFQLRPSSSEFFFCLQVLAVRFLLRSRRNCQGRS